MVFLEIHVGTGFNQNLKSINVKRGRSISTSLFKFYKMKYLLLLILFFLNLNTAVLSQEFRDQLSNEKISLVEIYAAEGKLIGITDTDGTVSSELKSKIKSSQTKYITAVNSFFENKIIPADQFDTKTIFKLNPIVNPLKEVFISKKKDENQYLIIKTYVRSLQINNEKVHYFIDGIVEYYISLTSNKIKIKFLANRSFENPSIKQLKEKGLTGIYFLIAGAPTIDSHLNYANLKQAYNFEGKEPEINLLSKDKNQIKGNLKMGKNGSNLSLEIISNDNPKIMKGLGIENSLENFKINALYSTFSFEDCKAQSLLYFKETRNYHIKAKKDISYQNIDAIHEVFILESRYGSAIEAKKLTSNYSFINKSSYSEKYWEKVNNSLFQTLPEPIEVFIKNNLKEL